MRILIDECLNWRLGRALTGHYAVSAQKMGWSGITNGKLLAWAMENGFDVFLTGDRNLTFQQNLHGIFHCHRGAGGRRGSTSSHASVGAQSRGTVADVETRAGWAGEAMSV